MSTDESCEHCGHPSVNYKLRACFYCGDGMCCTCEGLHDDQAACPLTLMCQRAAPPEPASEPLDKVMALAERVQPEVATWPEWKRRAADQALVSRPRSPEAQAARAPLPPESLVGALQDRDVIEPPAAPPSEPTYIETWTDRGTVWHTCEVCDEMAWEGDEPERHADDCPVPELRRLRAAHTTPPAAPPSEPAWGLYITEYPDEGCVGPFDTREEAEQWREENRSEDDADDEYTLIELTDEQAAALREEDDATPPAAPPSEPGLGAPAVMINAAILGVRVRASATPGLYIADGKSCSSRGPSPDEAVLNWVKTVCAKAVHDSAPPAAPEEDRTGLAEQRVRIAIDRVAHNSGWVLTTLRGAFDEYAAITAPLRAELARAKTKQETLRDWARACERVAEAADVQLLRETAAAARRENLDCCCGSCVADWLLARADALDPPKETP